MGSPADAVPATMPKSRAFGQPNACARHQPARPPTRGEALPAPRRRCQATLPVALSPLGRLPDLPAVLPGLRRRRHRRPRGYPVAPRLSGLAGSGRALAVADLSLAAGRLRLRRLGLHGGGPGVRQPLRLRRAHRGGARARPEAPARHRALPHVGRAPVVSRAPRLVHLGRSSQQLAVGLRWHGLGKARRAVLPALLLPRAARPRLAQPRGDRGDAGRLALLARPRRGRLPHRCHRPSAEGPAAARRPAGPRGLRPAAERGGGSSLR